MPTADKIQSHNHIPQLDGLRGIAILMVMCYHFFPDNIICNFGWSGVDLFFVLSGFLISSRLFPYLNDRHLLLKFYRNRFLRIVPLYFSFLILFFSGWFLLSSGETLNKFPFYQAHWWQYFLFLQNWIYASRDAQPLAYLQHLWSVAVEEQIYLVFPLLVILVKDKKKMLYLISGLVAVIILSRWFCYYHVIAQDQYLRIFNNTFLRADSFLSGVFVYLIYRSRLFFNKIAAAPWAVLFLLLVLVCHFIITGNAEKNNGFISTGGYSVIAFLYAGCLLSILSNRSGIINRFLSVSFLKFTGRISYGLYIFHWPLYVCGYIFLNKFFFLVNTLPNSNLVHFINVVICLPLSYLVSMLSFKYFESYFLKKKAASS